SSFCRASCDSRSRFSSSAATLACSAAATAAARAFSIFASATRRWCSRSSSAALASATARALASLSSPSSSTRTETIAAVPASAIPPAMNGQCVRDMPQNLTKSRSGVAGNQRHGVLGPRVLGVPAHELAAELRIVALPEAREILRDLDRALVRREQVEDEGHPAAGDGGAARQAEEVLEARRDPRRTIELVMDGHAAARELDVHRRHAIERGAVLGGLRVEEVEQGRL